MHFSNFLSYLTALFLLGTVLPTHSAAVRRASDNPLDAFLAAFKSISVAAANDLPDIFLYHGRYSIPQADRFDILRSPTILLKRAAFFYGPPVAGGPSYPGGIGGLAKAAIDVVDIQADIVDVLADDTLDAAKLVLQAPNYDGLQTLEDYVKIYTNNMQNSMPRGPDAGGLTNYTQDLFFSMERLSNSPYQLKRLDPTSDSLSFELDDDTTRKISGQTLNDLFDTGRLFYADYRDQKSLTKTAAFGTACDAYFYIDSRSGDLLPLAIRTNVGANLVYTPEDSENDWLLAKIMLNTNDFWFSQWKHLAATHEVVQITYMAAIRTLSEKHPVLGLLNRLMDEVFSIQPVAAVILFAPGLAVDQLFPYSGQAAQRYTTYYYQNKGAGRFKANYFRSELESRGLLNCNFGPALKHFPFYEDGTVIFNSIHTFMSSLVDSYYSSDSVVARDNEIQAWVREAQGPAKAIDFPSITTKQDLVDVLTHIAHLTTISHHTSNTNELLEISSLLPFHTPALYKAPPTSKGVTNVADYLPPFDKVALQLAVGGIFARPDLVGTNRTLIHMFDDAKLLNNMNGQTRAAATKFKQDMESFSAQVSTRTFGPDGLSQGMPFVWKALDPNVAPFSIVT